MLELTSRERERERERKSDTTIKQLLVKTCRHIYAYASLIDFTLNLFVLPKQNYYFLKHLQIAISKLTQCLAVKPELKFALHFLLSCFLILKNQLC